MPTRDSILSTPPGRVVRTILRPPWRFYLRQKAAARVKARRYLREMKYSGDNVTCPFCERNFSGFVPSGALERAFWKSPEGLELLKRDYINVADGQCPSCGGGERHRLLYFYLIDRLKIGDQKGIRLLDVAPDGFLTDKIFSKAEIDYVSTDLHSVRSPTVLNDLTKMSFKDDVFDAIVCCHVLEHIPDDMAAISELFRVLKPGGWALLQVPIWAQTTVEDPSAPRERYLELYGHFDHVRRYGLDYPQRLEAAGFEVEIDEFVRHMPRDQITRFGLFETEDVFLAKKPSR